MDKEGKLIHIGKARRGEEYACPHCKAAMIPRQGKINRWHFAHKNNVSNCSYETYLHQIAKTKIREHFLTSPSFYIAYNTKVYCSAKCPLDKEACRIKTITKRFDLRKYYNCCEEEREHKGYRADLMLFHDQEAKREPVLIEICVTHPCETKKRNSGIRIIEIHIQSEEDIDQITKTSFIQETSGFIGDSVKEDKRVQFYNFQNTEKGEPEEPQQCLLYVYRVDSNHDFRVDRPKCCKLTQLPYFSTDPFLLVSEENQDWTWCAQKALQKGIQVKSCILCKYRVHDGATSPICALYKKFGTPQHPKIIEARTCKYYRKNMTTNCEEYEEKYHPHYKIIPNTPTPNNPTPTT